MSAVLFTGDRHRTLNNICKRLAEQEGGLPAVAVLHTVDLVSREIDQSMKAYITTRLTVGDNTV